MSTPFVSITARDRTRFFLLTRRQSNPLSMPAMVPALDTWRNPSSDNTTSPNLQCRRRRGQPGTKAGTNRFTSVFDFSARQVGANDFFVNRAGLPLAPFRYNQFVATRRSDPQGNILLGSTKVCAGPR